MHFQLQNERLIRISALHMAMDYVDKREAVDKSKDSCAMQTNSNK